MLFMMLGRWTNKLVSIYIYRLYITKSYLAFWLKVFKTPFHYNVTEIF